MEYKSGLRVVIINGRPGVGKTLFEIFCKEIIGHPYCKMRSTIDKVKEIAMQAGWDGDKSLAARKMLSDLKAIFTAYNDMPFNDIVKYVKSWELELQYYGVENRQHILFVDDREPEHIERLKKALDATTVLIRRPGDEEIETSNSSDGNVFNYKYDWVINNDGNPEKLKEKAEVFLNSLFS